MLIWGTKTKTVDGENIEGFACPECGKGQSSTFGIIKYFHLFWIPTFLTSKTAGIECTHCKKTLIGKEIPEELSENIRSTVFTKGNTLPMFSGLLIIALIASSVVYMNHRDNLNDLAYIEQPAVNDLYVVDLTKMFEEQEPTFKYGVMRIKNLTATQVEFQTSKFSYDSLYGAEKALRYPSQIRYDDESSHVDINQLKGLKDSRAIFSITRKDS